jgi:hypothetical protein
MKFKNAGLWEYSFTLMFPTNLTNEAKLFVEQCVGYSASKNVRGETPSFEWGVGYVNVHLDTTKSRRDDIGDIVSDGFWTDIEKYLQEGSPKRVRQNGTRLFEKPYSCFVFSENVCGIVLYTDKDNKKEALLYKLDNQIRVIQTKIDELAGSVSKFEQLKLEKTIELMLLRKS